VDRGAGPVSRYAEIFGKRERTYVPLWKPSELCATDCGFKRVDDYGFCAIHKLEHVVMTYRKGWIDALPIKQELRRRMVANDQSQLEMAAVLGLHDRRLTRILSPYRVWVRHKEADFWFTLLQIDAPAEFWEAA
jgi:hypothetical protein